MSRGKSRSLGGLRFQLLNYVFDSEFRRFFRFEVDLPIDIGETHARSLRWQLTSPRLRLGGSDCGQSFVHDSMIRILPVVIGQLAREAGPVAGTKFTTA